MMINSIYLHIDIHLIPRIQLISVVWVKSSKIWVIWVGVYILIYLDILPKKCHVVLKGAKDLIIGAAWNNSSPETICHKSDCTVTKVTRLRKWGHKQLPSGKLTKPWKIPMFNRKYIFKGSIFHCYVSLPEGISLKQVVIFYHLGGLNSEPLQLPPPPWSFPPLPGFAAFPVRLPPEEQLGDRDKGGQSNGSKMTKNDWMEVSFFQFNRYMIYIHRCLERSHTWHCRIQGDLQACCKIQYEFYRFHVVNFRGPYHDQYFALKVP